MKEKNITAAILRYLKAVPGCFCWKEHGGIYGTSGLPDIICCVNGRFVAFEVKTEDGRLSKLQELAIAKITAAGGAAFMVRSVAEVRQHLEKIQEDV
jgi:mevalonate kinase